MTRAPQPGQEIPVEQVSGGVLARMRPELSVGAALPPAGRQRSGWRQPGSLARTRRLGDNAGMARDDSWAQVLRVALPILDEARPAGVLGWVRPCRPGCDPGRRRGRALGRRAPAAGPGRVDERCWLRAGGVGPGHGSADPGRGATEHATEHAAEHPAAAKGGPVARAWPQGPRCRPDADTRGPPPGAPPSAGPPPFSRPRTPPSTGLLPLSWGWSSACGGACATRGG